MLVLVLYPNPFFLKSSILVILLLFLFNPVTALAQSNSANALQQWKAMKEGKLQLDKGQQISLVNRIAQDYVNQAPDSAVIYANHALELLGAGDVSSESLQAHKTLTKAYYVLSNSSESYSHSLKVIEIARQLEDQKSVLFGQVQLGLSYMLQNRLRESIDVFWDFLALAEKLNDTASIARAYLDLSIALEALKSYDSAVTYVDKSIEFASAVGESYYLAMAYNRKGYVLSNLGNYEDARQNHFNALEIMDSTNTWERGFAFAGLAQAYGGLGNFEQGIIYGEKSLELARQMDAKWEIRNSAEILSRVYAQVGDYEKAYEYHKLYKLYHDSIFTEDNEKRIVGLEVRQARTERDALQIENELQSQILEQRNTQLILVAVITVILVVLLGVLYVNAKSRKKYAEEISLQRDRLDELNRSKDKILSLLAHDMRSPINSIIQLIYLMKNDRDEHVDYDTLLEEVYQRTNAISISLKGILEWAVRQFQQKKPELSACEISLVVDEQMNLCDYDANLKQIKIEHDKTGAVNVMVDHEQLRIMVRNLISNAIKFSRNEGKIQVYYNDLGDRLGLSIRDEGIGMSEEQVAGLFQNKGVSTRGTNNEAGTGLGLFICKEFAEMNGGSLEVVSKKGEGSEFSLILKKA